MRQSVAPNRASVTQGGSSAANLSKLTEKKKEYDAVSALERASALYLERLEALGDDCDIMADAGEGKALFSHSLQHAEWYFSAWSGSCPMAEDVPNSESILYALDCLVMVFCQSNVILSVIQSKG